MNKVLLLIISCSTVSGGTVTTAGGVVQALLQQNTAVGRAMGVQTQMHATAMRSSKYNFGATQF